jgi:hypothetical protein
MCFGGASHGASIPNFREMQAPGWLAAGEVPDKETLSEATCAMCWGLPMPPHHKPRRRGRGVGRGSWVMGLALDGELATPTQRSRPGAIAATESSMPTRLTAKVWRGMARDLVGKGLLDSQN